jgi:predicted AAA+ superfamily ATPase
MHPFVPAELAERFDLAQALRFGLLPIVRDSSEPEETLSAYTQLYLREEIQAEAVVRNLPGFSRFLPIAALYHGQTVNVTNMSREAGIARTTAIGYLEILEDTLLCFRIPGLEAKLRVRERKHPKWYWCDPGLVRAMKRSAGPVLPEEKGALFEGLVAQLIRAYRDYAGICDDISYWSGGSRESEVDFVLAQGAKRIAIEVKSGRQFHEQWCRGLRAIAPLEGLMRRFVVYPSGPELRTEDGIEVVSLERFSELLAASDSLWQDGTS